MKCCGWQKQSNDTFFSGNKPQKHLCSVKKPDIKEFIFLNLHYVKCSEKGTRKLTSGSQGTWDWRQERDEWILWGDGNVLKLPGCGGGCTTQQIYCTRVLKCL